MTESIKINMDRVQQENIRLLEDALSRTVNNPEVSFAWHSMAHLLRKLANPNLSLQIEKAILKNVGTQGNAGFLRATFLDVLTGRPEYLVEAGKALLDLPTFDPDRAIIFIQSSWQRVLLDTPNRNEFYTRLSEIGLPEITSTLRQYARRKLLHLPRLQLSRRTPTTIKKVAVVAPLLANVKHPPTLMALQQARCLRESGIEVALFSAQEMLGPNSEHFLGSGITNQAIALTNQGWEQYLGHRNIVVKGDTRFSISQRWCSIAEHIAQYDPDLILHVGLYTGQIELLYDHRPTLGLGVNSLAPLTPSDTWLTAQRNLDQSDEKLWGSDCPIGIATYHPYRLDRPASIALASNSYRQEFGWGEQNIVLVTFVNEAEVRISGNWAHGMCQALTYFPHLRWLIVGGNGRLPSSLRDTAANQVHCLAFCADAIKFLHLADIYINPPMMGGGFSVAEAMAYGVPAVCISDTDGGDKLGEEAADDFKSYFKQLQDLIENKEYRNAVGSRQQKHFDTNLDLAQSYASLQDACQLALTRFNSRHINII